MGLQALTSSVNPIVLADAKTQLRIVDDLTDPDTEALYSSDDAALSTFIDAAHEYIATETRQQFVNRNYLYTLDRFPGDNFPFWEHCSRVRTDPELKLPLPPLQAVASVQYTDKTGSPQTLDPTTYSVNTTCRPGRIVLKPGFAWPVVDHSAACVRITFTAGYGADASTVPTILKQAILLLAGAWFEQREDSMTLRTSCIPIGVKAIIDQNRYDTAQG